MKRQGYTLISCCIYSILFLMLLAHTMHLGLFVYRQAHAIQETTDRLMQWYTACDLLSNDGSSLAMQDHMSVLCEGISDMRTVQWSYDRMKLIRTEKTATAKRKQSALIANHIEKASCSWLDNTLYFCFEGYAGGKCYSFKVPVAKREFYA